VGRLRRSSNAARKTPGQLHRRFLEVVSLVHSKTGNRSRVPAKFSKSHMISSSGLSKTRIQLEFVEHEHSEDMRVLRNELGERRNRSSGLTGSIQSDRDVSRQFDTALEPLSIRVESSGATPES